MKIVVKIFLIFCALSLVSCDDLFTQSKGIQKDFDGKWQLKYMEDEDGNISKVDTVYYNFQNNLFDYQMYLTKDSILGVFGHCVYSGDTEITITLDGYAYRMNYYKYPAGYDFLPVVGWNDTNRTYKIEQITGSELRLTYENIKYVFCKF